MHNPENTQNTFGKQIGALLSKILNFKTKRWITIAFTTIMLCLLIYGLSVQWKNISSYQWNLNLVILVKAAILHLLALVIMQILWHLMMRTLHTSSSFWKDFTIYGITLASRRIPAPLTQYGSRFFLYRTPETSNKVVLTASIIETLLFGIAGLVTIVTFGCFSNIDYIKNLAFLILPLLLVGAGILLLKKNSLISTINRILLWMGKPPFEVVINGTKIFGWILGYFCVWLLDGIALRFVISATTSTFVGFLDTINVFAVSSMVGYLLQFFPFSFGLKEISLGYLFASNFPVEAGIVIAFFFRFFSTIIEVVWALILKLLPVSGLRTNTV
jgi:uncharacterized membrane protein YbhN (UPF0104 family)